MLSQQERNRRISEGLRLAWKRRKEKEMVFSNCNVCGIKIRTANEDRMGMCEQCAGVGPMAPAVKAKPEQLAEKFHNLYEQLAPEHGYETRKESAVTWENVPAKNKALMIDVCKHLLATCQELSIEELTEKFYQLQYQRDKLLDACDLALAAYAEALKTGNSTIWNGKNVDKMRAAVKLSRPRAELTCANCTEVSTNPGQFLRDGRWVCTESCRKELATKQSMDDLAASGGIVGAP